MLVSLRMGFHQPFLGKVDRKSEYDTPWDDQFVIRKILSTIKQNESSWNTIFSILEKCGFIWSHCFLRLKNGLAHGFPLNSSTGWDEHAQNLGISAGDLKM